ncbi:thiamine biosynthesis protein ThiS [Photobacterium phosphoreum]|uniref:sulfur carrier protein ThiS n=1 Tax=Photobacterium phosphoreum TaxID=659 RepID=UPI000D159B1E|nr:sulfur carrier protein ThiS [Photobacterium phosphoreum]PSU82575.1 thiamine biosynthesis protein ThiS [Photobacterium phosphoreum]PSW32954.1 thiamine biosynthesis protein ThiS [Photobacterium phosphoreum]PTB32848.1 thiamine biosynthesis protein ThiS [Photobacterium phosphoreum]
MTIITVWLNNQAIECQSQQSLIELVEQLTLPTLGAAIAINQAIITRSDWSTTVLNHNDQITLFQVIAGG